METKLTKITMNIKITMFFKDNCQYKHKYTSIKIICQYKDNYASINITMLVQR